MAMKIKSIKIFWDKIMNSENKVLFSWEDKNKAINIFYYNNWYWKTTLFTFIKESFLWNKIKDKFISLFEMKLLINNEEYLIKNSPIDWLNVTYKSNLINYADFKKILEKKILNKNEKLAVAWRNPQWEQKRNTLESLLRFNFFSDDEFKKYTQQSCSLINSDLDWDTKWIMLNYILWESFNRDKEKLFRIAYKYWAKQKILNNTKSIWKNYKEYFTPWNQLKLFDNPEKQFNKLIKQKIILKDSLIQLESIILKLDEIKKESIKYLKNNGLIINLIKREHKKLKTKKIEYEENFSIIKNQISDLIYDYWDLIKWVTSTTKKAIESRKKALEYVNNNKKLVEDYYRNNKSLFNQFKVWFLKELTNWIFNFDNIIIDNRELKLSIWWWADEKKWDWRLKTLRFLALIWIILFKAKNNYARNLWIWFFDSPFYWVDMLNSTKALNSISSFIENNKLSTQLFIFATKEENNSIEDSFEKELKKNKNIYFHPYDYENKEYLIS